MHRSITLSLCILAMVLLSGVTISCSNDNPAGPNTSKSDVEGTWVGHDRDDTTTYFVSITNHIFSINSSSPSGNILCFAGTFFMDSSANPKRIDAYLAQSGEPSYVGQTSLGIYNVVNDTFWWSANEPGLTEYPATFLPPDTGNTAMHWVLVRR